MFSHHLDCFLSVRYEPLNDEHGENRLIIRAYDWTYKPILHAKFGNKNSIGIAAKRGKVYSCQGGLVVYDTNIIDAPLILVSFAGSYPVQKPIVV